MRAATRGMKPASYLVALVHAHVRGVAPLPVSDLNGLKTTVNQLAAVSRCLQEIAQRDGASDRDGELAARLHDTLQQVQTLRQHTADIVRANVRSAAVVTRSPPLPSWTASLSRRSNAADLNVASIAPS